MRGGTGGGWRRKARGAVGLAAALLLLWQGLLALYPYPYAAQVQAAARRDGLDPLLILAVIRSESRFRPDSTSHRGARGLMQILPETGRWAAGQMPLPDFDPDELYQPAVNIAVGSWYLAEMRREFGGRMVAALAAYNAGPQPVRRWLAAGLWSGGATDLERIPYPETRAYVRHVLGTWHIYRILYRPWGGGGGTTPPPPPPEPATIRTPSE